MAQFRNLRVTTRQANLTMAEHILMEQTKQATSLSVSLGMSSLSHGHDRQVEWKVNNFLKTDVKVNKTIAAAKKVKDSASMAKEEHRNL